MSGAEGKAPKTIFVIDAREPVLRSWMRDGVSFAVLCASAWFANTQMPPSGWINFMICLIWFTWMVGKANRHRTHMSADEARAWLDKNYPTALLSQMEGRDG